MFDDDLATMLADPLITVPASIGRASTRGIFDWKDVLEDDGSGFVPVSRRVLTIAAGSLAGLPDPGGSPGDVDITIDGTSYRVRKVEHVSLKTVSVTVA